LKKIENFQRFLNKVIPLNLSIEWIAFDPVLSVLITDNILNFLGILND
jgi:hypothetical protein